MSFVAKVTGKKVTEVRGDYDALCQQFSADDIDPPTREEVDTFLVRQIVRAQREPNMTEPRREKIIRRLKEGLGKVMPTPAQFRAWTALMGEKWNGAKKKVATLVAVSALSFSLGACGNGGTSASDVEPTAGATHTSATRESEEKSDAAVEFEAKYLSANDRSKWDIGPVKVTASAKAKFSAAEIKAVEAASDDMYFDLYGSDSWHRTYLSEGDAKAAVKASTKAYLTRYMQKRWASLVEEYYSKPERRSANSGWGEVVALSNLDLVPKSYLPDGGTPFAVAGKITEREINIRDAQYPRMSMVSEQQLNTQSVDDKTGKVEASTYKVVRTIEFTYEMKAGKPRLRGWEVNVNMDN